MATYEIFVQTLLRLVSQVIVNPSKDDDHPVPSVGRLGNERAVIRGFPALHLSYDQSEGMPRRNLHRIRQESEDVLAFIVDLSTRILVQTGSHFVFEQFPVIALCTHLFRDPIALGFVRIFSSNGISHHGESRKPTTDFLPRLLENFLPEGCRQRSNGLLPASRQLLIHQRDRHITLGMLHAESNLEFTETVTNVIQKHIQSNQIRGGKWGHD